MIGAMIVGTIVGISRTLALAALVPAAAPVSGGAGEQAARVVVVCAPNASPLLREAARRIVAELEARGFAAGEGAPAPGRERRAEIVAAARTAGAWAAIGIWPASVDEVEVWSFDVVKRQLVVLPVDVRLTVATNPALVVAVRATELLRAGLMEAQRRPDVPTPPPTLFAAATPPSVTAAPRFTLTLAAAAFRDLDGPGISFAPALAFAVSGARVGGRLGLLGLGSSQHATAAAGDAALTPTVAVAELLVRPFSHRAAPELAVGFGAKHISVVGDANVPYVSETAGLWTAVASAGLGTGIALTSWLALAGELRVLVAARAPRLRLRDELTEPRGRVSSWATLGLRGEY